MFLTNFAISFNEFTDVAFSNRMHGNRSMNLLCFLSLLSSV